MSPMQILGTVILALIVLAIVGGAWFLLRGNGLRRRFGPEYDRVLAESPNRAAAENELRERERRHAQLDLRELTPESRTRYIGQWRALQAHFVDSPAEALGAADELITRLVAEIGYPTDDYDEQLAQLSVEHARNLAAYRDAHDVYLLSRKDQATTEQLRAALVRYRALVTELLGSEAHLVASPDATASATRPSTKERRTHAT